MPNLRQEKNILLKSPLFDCFEAEICESHGCMAKIRNYFRDEKIWTWTNPKIDRYFAKSICNLWNKTRIMVQWPCVSSHH